MTKKTAVLISGAGSNLQALIEAARAPDYPAEISLVISNKAEAAGLERARVAGIPVCIIDHRHYADRAGFEAALHAALLHAQIEIVCLAGFMRILGAEFVQKWQGKMINIHPSLLPDFKGINTHARVLEAGVAETGCTAHFVIPDLDAGPIILQARVPVLPTDTAASLAQRVLAEEHKLYPAALRLLAEGQISL